MPLWGCCSLCLIAQMSVKIGHIIPVELLGFLTAKVVAVARFVHNAGVLIAVDLLQIIVMLHFFQHILDLLGPQTIGERESEHLKIHPEMVPVFRHIAAISATLYSLLAKAKGIRMSIFSKIGSHSSS